MRKDVKNPGIGSGGLNKIKTHCIHGHSLFGSNVWIRIRDQKKSRYCKTCTRRRSNESRFRIKQKAVRKLGGKCVWPKCLIRDIDMLTVDHIKDDGAKHRTRGKSRGNQIYPKILKDRFAKRRYQILCANHNLKKEILRQRGLRS